MKILVDANQGWQMPWDISATWDHKTALWMADALAELDVFWLEEPLHRHDYRGLAALRKRAKLRLSGIALIKGRCNFLHYNARHANTSNVEAP